MATTTPDLTSLRRFLEASRGLCTASVARADGSVSASVVNGGLLPHPHRGDVVLGMVVRGSAHKLRRLRRDGRATVSVLLGWEWQAVEGPVELIGPHDPPAGGAVDLPALLRAVYTAAGGTHDDWPEFDRVMAAEARTAVLLRPARVYGVTSGR